MGVLIPGHLSCKYKAKATLLANQKIVVLTPIHTALSVNCSAGVRASIDVRSKKLSGLSKTK